MTNRETYDVVNKHGEVKEYPIGLKPITARSRRLSKDGSEVHSGHLVVNPLHRMPSPKQMIDQMTRSGELAMRMRAVENLQLAEDGDPSFHGYTRDWLEENFITEFEADYVRARVDAFKAPPEPSTPPATIPPEAPADPAPASPQA